MGKLFLLTQTVSISLLNLILFFSGGKYKYMFLKRNLIIVYFLQKNAKGIFTPIFAEKSRQ